MKLTKEEALLALYGDHDDYVTIEDIIDGKRRWSVEHRRVVYNIKEDKFYITNYSVGATEQQDECPWEYDKEVTFHEAESYIEPVTKYRVKP